MEKSRCKVICEKIIVQIRAERGRRMEYIIVQAGGIGSRMQKYTKNKPKALVPIHNLPIIFHLFHQYKDKKYIIIGDYKKDVMRSYLHAFAEVQHMVVGTDGKKGTCSGIANALMYIPDDEPFLIIWSDLVLPEAFEIPEKKENFIGISKGFSCRWSYENCEFEERKSKEHGVAGLFLFKEKNEIEGVPCEGEFVAWLKEKCIAFTELPLVKTREYGLYETVEKPEGGYCRPFNRVRIEGDRFIKEGIDSQGTELAKREAAWYKVAGEYGIDGIPKIYQTDPLVMQYISGKNVYLCAFDMEQKRKLLSNIVSRIKEIHSHGIRKPDYFSIHKAYFLKTMERLRKVRDLIPGAESPVIEINQKKCRNVFFHQEELEEKIAQRICDRFCFIHGDCTFSNIIVDNEMETWFIDPRGYFGNTELYGDPLYDWTKLYYSIVGNYDRFNLKQFELEISDDGKIQLKIQSSGWEELEEYYFSLLGDEVSRDDLKLIHAIIWLSLTTYTWEDYDSICAAFYNGLFYLEDLL